MSTVSFGSLVRCRFFSAVLVAVGWCEPGVDPFCALSDDPPVADWLRLRRRRADRLVPVPALSDDRPSDVPLSGVLGSVRAVAGRFPDPPDPPPEP
jgi:hypothetical protein